MKVYFISVIMLAVLSCNNKMTPDAPKNPEALKTEKSVSSDEALPECLADRATLGEVLAQQGNVVKVTDQLMISYGTSSRCIPCNLPAHIKEGDKVSFSGNIKQPPPGVRMAGTPISLILIEKI